MIRIIILFFCIISSFAYPTWFEQYIEKFDKTYNEHQMQIAFNILKPKYEHIQKHKNNFGLHLRLHKDSDKERKISRRLHDMKKRSNPTGISKKKTMLGLPLSFDWRTYGTVTAVKEQGECGGCYCFSAIDNLEYYYKKKTGKLKNLSVQECLDCTNKKITDSDGCGGGLMEDLFKMAKYWNIVTAEENPFKMKNKVCQNTQPNHGIRVKSYQVMSDESNSQIENHLAHNLLKYGPIPVGVDSSSLNFELYKKGIIKEIHCGKKIDHAVTVVGFGIDKNIRYWIIKNSWGKHWGENGYFKLERDRNACGINSYSSFATAVEVV